jgi:hypothetical protein
LVIGLISAGCIFGGAFLGMWLHKVLPERHLDDASKDTVKLGAGLLATLAALVLGLLVSSAKASFDAMNTGIAQAGAKVLLIDHMLADYGPETKDVREQLRHIVASSIDRIWPEEKGRAGGLRAMESLDDAGKLFRNKLRELTPTNDFQKSRLAQAVQLSDDVLQTRLLVMEGEQTNLPATFIVVLVFWLTGLFISFGLFAPSNGVVMTVLLICALSVSSAIFLENEPTLRWIHQGLKCSAAQSRGTYWQVTPLV